MKTPKHKSNKISRGKASKIDSLPAEIKSQLSIMLRDKSYSQKAILEEINSMIVEAGLEDCYKLSRSGLNRYSSKMEAIGKDIREAREVAEMWTKQFGEAPEGDVGKLAIEIIKNIAFKTSLDLNANDPESLNQMALALQRLEQASKISYDREKAIRDEVSKKIATAIKAEAKAQGRSKKDILKLVQAVYGIN